MGIPFRYPIEYLPLKPENGGERLDERGETLAPLREALGTETLFKQQRREREKSNRASPPS